MELNSIFKSISIAILIITVIVSAVVVICFKINLKKPNINAVSYFYQYFVFPLCIWQFLLIAYFTIGKPLITEKIKEAPAYTETFKVLDYNFTKDDNQQLQIQVTYVENRIKRNTEIALDGVESSYDNEAHLECRYYNWHGITTNELVFLCPEYVG